MGATIEIVAKRPGLYILFLLTVRAYLAMQNPPQKCIVLRHDIDRKTMNALRMAELEHELGIQSTYYFRVPYTFKPDIIRKMHDFFSDTRWTKLELGEQDEGFYGRYFVKDKKYFRTSMYQTTLYGEGPRRGH